MAPNDTKSVIGSGQQIPSSHRNLSALVAHIEHLTAIDGRIKQFFLGNEGAVDVITVSGTAASLVQSTSLITMPGGGTVTLPDASSANAQIHITKGLIKVFVASSVGAGVTINASAPTPAVTLLVATACVVYMWTGTQWTVISYFSGAAGGAGTVTSVSVVSANGLAGTVATPTTTPAITLNTTTILGALTSDGAGVIGSTGAGVLGQVLTSNGPGVIPTFQAVGSGGAGSAATSSYLIVDTFSIANSGAFVPVTTAASWLAATTGVFPVDASFAAAGTGVFTAPATGVYKLYFQGVWAIGSNAGTRQLRIFKSNAVTAVISQCISEPSSDDTINLTQAVEGIAALTVGDTVRFEAAVSALAAGAQTLVGQSAALPLTRAVSMIQIFRLS